MSDMFCRATNFNDNMSNWNENLVTTMDYVLAYAKSFTANLSN